MAAGGRPGDYNSQHAQRGQSRHASLLPLRPAAQAQAGLGAVRRRRRREAGAMALNRNHSEGGGVIVNNSEK